MTNDIKTEVPVSFAQRKERLIREGAAYRAAMRGARDVVSYNLQTDSLARSVVSHLTGSAYAAAGQLLKVNGANLQTMLPVVLSGASLILRAGLLRPILRTSAIAAAAGTAAYFLFFRKPPREPANEA